MVAHFAGGRYALCRRAASCEVDPDLRRFAHRVVVDHESRGGLCLGHDEAERDIAFRRTCTHDLEQLLASERRLATTSISFIGSLLLHSMAAWKTVPDPPAAPPTVAGVGGGRRCRVPLLARRTRRARRRRSGCGRS